MQIVMGKMQASKQAAIPPSHRPTIQPSHHPTTRIISKLFEIGYLRNVLLARVDVFISNDWILFVVKRRRVFSHGTTTQKSCHGISWHVMSS